MGRKRTKHPLEGIQSDETAKKRVWALLQVLSGQMGVTEAAKAAVISVPRYYQLEKKALGAMLLALSPMQGRGQPMERLEKLQKQSEVLQEENARQKQLLRMARRLWGPMAESEVRKRKDEQAGAEPVAIGA